MKRAVAALACALAVAAASAGGGQLVPIPNARIPMEGVLSGGQPTREQIEAAAAAGFKTVINLRTGGEEGFAWEAETVERLGMRYVTIPVAGAGGVSFENAARLDAALRESREAGPVLLHCGSGNRIGALLALRAASVEGKEPDEALRIGLDAGLTRLEGRVRELLGIASPVSESPDGGSSPPGGR